LGFVLLALLATHHTLVSPKIWLLVIGFLLSNFVILFLPVSTFRNPAVGYAVFFLDVTVLTVFFYAISGVQTESLLLYYLTVFMATLGADLRKSVGIAVVAGALYMGFHLSQGVNVLWNPEVLMHVPLFFVTAVSTGYLAQEVGAYKRRIKNLKDIQQTLESDIEVSSEDLTWSPSERVAAQDLARRFHDLVQGLDVIVWEADAATLLFVFVSRRAEEILGYPAEQWVTIPNFWTDHIHPEDRERTTTQFRATLFAGTDHEFEYRMTASDGRVIWFRNIVRVIRDGGGRALRVRGVMLDITKQKLAEERDLLFMLSLDMMCILGFDGYFKRLNPAWEKTLGHTREELQAVPFMDFVHPDDREPTLAEAEKLFTGQRTISFENRFRTKDGSYKWFLWTAAPLLERKLIYGVARDNTERKRAEEEIKKLNDELELRVAERTAQLKNSYLVLKAEVAERKQAVEALRESESSYRDLVENSGALIGTQDLEGTFLSANLAGLRIFGCDRAEDLVGHKLSEYLAADVLDQFQSYLQDVQKNGHAQGLMKVRTRKGEQRIIEFDNSLRREGMEKPIIRCIGRDITEHKRAMEALRESEASLAEAQRIAHLGNWDWDIVQNKLRWSREIFSIFGIREESFGSTYEAFMNSVHPDDRELVQKAVDEALAGGKRYNINHRVVRPDGAERVVQEQGEVLFDRACGPIRMVGTVQDITEQRSLQAQLLQSQKMEAIGQLAGGVAHDFNNLLTIISGYSQLLMENDKLDESVRNHIKEILKASDRAASLTRQLLAFSRRQVLAPQVLDLNALVGNVDKMLRRLIGEDIDLVTQLAPGLGRVKADPGQIEQVIMNLAVNARDAMPGGGKLTLETANADLDETYTRTHFPTQPGPYVMLAVSDSGVGMDAATQAHMFEPFFTTKEQGKGTGLGLATVYGIVKQSNGYIWVYSELGRGSTFKIYLPRVEANIAESRAEETSSVVHRASEVVLVVEDETAVRALVKDVLTSNGYTVLEASRGDEALSICDQHKGPIHLMVTDVIMPQMSGRELATRLASLRPDMKVLFMSGYTNEGIVHQGVLERDTAFLQKPFTPNSLARKVREVLDASSKNKAPAA
jgi:PAS domain S-box-containing protein